MHACSIAESYLTLCNPWTEAHQATLSVEFSQQEYWSGLPFPPRRGLPNQGIKPTSLASPSLAGRVFTTAPSGSPWLNGNLVMSVWVTWRLDSWRPQDHGVKRTDFGESVKLPVVYSVTLDDKALIFSMPQAPCGKTKTIINPILTIKRNHI